MDDVDFEGDNPSGIAQPYFRYQPVAAPALTLYRKTDGLINSVPAEGESMEIIAIRSFNETYDDNALSKQIATRFIVPSQVSIREAEVNGNLDEKSVKNVVGKDKFQMLKNKDIVGSENNPVFNEEKVEPSGQSYASFLEEQELPYLPDPMAKDVMVKFVNYSAFGDVPIRIPLYPEVVSLPSNQLVKKSWPDALPIKLTLSEDSRSLPVSKPGALAVSLPKGDRVKVRLSMAPYEEDLILAGKDYGKFGGWEWIKTLPNYIKYGLKDLKKLSPRRTALDDNSVART